MAVHTTHYKDARVHYPDLKQQPHTQNHTHPHRRTQPRARTNDTDTPSHERATGDAEETAPTPHHRTRPGHRPNRTPQGTCVYGSDSSEPQQCAPTHQHHRPAHQTRWQTGPAGIQTGWTRAGECR